MDNSKNLWTKSVCLCLSLRSSQSSQAADCKRWGMRLFTYCTLPKILAGLQISLGGNFIRIECFFPTKSGRLSISIWSPVAFLSTQQPFLVFGEGQVNFPAERLQQVLHFSNCAGFISNNQFASRSYYSIHLCQDRRQFAPVHEKKSSWVFICAYKV